MAELDLTKAKARAAEEAIGYVGGCVCDEAWTSRKLVDPTCGWHLIEGLAEDIVNAALPHILDALRVRAVEEMDAAEPFSVEMDDIDAVVRWLRARAEEAHCG